MIFIWLSPLYLAVNIFYIYEAFKWIDSLIKIPQKAGKVVKIIIAILWSLFMVAIFVPLIMPYSISRVDSPMLYTMRRVCKEVANYHLGVFIYMGMLFIVLLISRLIELIYLRAKGKDINILKSPAYRNRRAILGIANIILIVVVTMCGVANAKNIRVTEYEIETGKQSATFDELNVVLIADLHIGYNAGVKQIEKMVNLVNQQDADIILIAGDIFDNEYEAIEDPSIIANLLGSMESRLGTYAVYGNHDISEKIIGGFTFNWDDKTKESDIRMDELLDNAGITLLSDEAVLIDDGFYIYGRPDYSKPGRGIDKRKSPEEIVKGLDDNKLMIVLEHEPVELSELSESGIDIDLNGHTHDGQFFPMNITSRFTWENSCGMIKKGNMTDVVTSGVGVFGPNIRIGTKSEICNIRIKFNNNN